MSSDSEANLEAMRAQVAQAFDRSLDPLAEIATTMETMDVDPFELFVAFDLETRDITPGTIEKYRAVFGEWKEHMTAEGRHPACPSEAHIRSFIRKEQEKGNATSTIRLKLVFLKAAYAYWRQDAAFPHPMDYAPFQAVIDSTAFEPDEEKEWPRITLDDLRDHMAELTGIRQRAMVALQLKLGLRAGEVGNIQLPEISIEHAELRRHYPDLGTRLEGRPNAILIPHDREGNKSRRSRILPLDDEMRRVLLRYLLIRPTADAPWLFLSKQEHRHINGGPLNDAWAAFIGDSYPELTSHFGRHWFTTYWRVDRGLNREFVKYMRGDIVEKQDSQDTMDTYLHTYYEDIEPIYREQVFKLNL